MQHRPRQLRIGDAVDPSRHQDWQESYWVEIGKRRISGSMAAAVADTRLSGVEFGAANIGDGWFAAFDPARRYATLDQSLMVQRWPHWRQHTRSMRVSASATSSSSSLKRP